MLRFKQKKKIFTVETQPKQWQVAACKWRGESYSHTKVSRVKTERKKSKWIQTESGTEGA